MVMQKYRSPVYMANTPKEEYQDRTFQQSRSLSPSLVRLAFRTLHQLERDQALTVFFIFLTKSCFLFSTVVE
jgi:hypothetical protein